MMQVLSAALAPAGMSVKDRSGHAWTVVGPEQVDEHDSAAGTVVHVVDSQGRHQWFPPAATFYAQGG